VFDAEPNFSDHLPVITNFKTDSFISTQSKSAQDIRIKTDLKLDVKYLRWHHADLMFYYFDNYNRLLSVLEKLDKIYKQFLLDDLAWCRQNSGDLGVNLQEVVNKVYDNVVHVLSNSAINCVPSASKEFYKFWWDQELSCLKDESIAAHNAWKNAGKPNSGDLAEQKRLTKAKYIKIHS